jgi:hypothetical protein
MAAIPQVTTPLPHTLSAGVEAIMGPLRMHACMHACCAAAAAYISHTSSYSSLPPLTRIPHRYCSWRPVTTYRLVQYTPSRIK